jgi:IS5 family transposase
MVGLHLIKHRNGLSDEAVCARFLDSPYVQLFCGESHVQHALPLDRSSMTRWRQRNCAERLELLLAAPLAAAQRAGAAEPKHFARVTVDTTVQPKAVAHPTDSKLIHRGVEILGRLARRHGIALRQSYTRVSARARREVAKLIHRGPHREAERMVSRMRTAFATPLARSAQLLRQRREDRGREKIYALHAPEVECIAGPQPRCAETRLGTRARARPARASSSGARSRSPPPVAQRRAERS